MNRVKLSLSSLSLAAATSIAQAQSPSFTQLDAVIDNAVQEQHLVGAVVLVAYKGQVVYRRAAGLADREAGTPMREDAIFRLASVTKPIVTVAALQLVEQGLLRLHAPVQRWLPSFRPRQVDGTDPEITLHQLLTHTAGLSYGFMESSDGPYRQAGVSDGLDEGITLEENLRRVANVPLAYSPGANWRYSIGLDVLGAAMSAATKRSLPDIVRGGVVEPLGMVDTGFSVIDAKRLVTPYMDGTPSPVRMGSSAEVPLFQGTVRFHPARIWDQQAYASGGGGMVGTAPDFMNLLLSLRPQSTRRVLKPDSIRDMLRDHVGPSAQTQGPGWGFGYGGSVLVDADSAKTPQGQGTLQWGGVYGHSWFFDPEHDVTVVAFTNTAIAGMMGQFPNGIRDAVYGSVIGKRIQ